MKVKEKMPKPFAKARTNLLWFTFKDPITGKWRQKSTGTSDEREAERFVAVFVKELAKGMERAANGALVPGPLTVRGYAKQWTSDREKRGVGSARDDMARLEKYVLPALGAMRMADVKSKDIRDVVRALREADELAPRTIIDIFNSMHAMFSSAEVDEVVERNPVMLKPGELPKKRDKDPTWRSQATYTVNEVERLISDAEIPVERRVQYALKAIAGMRHGEVAALRWRHIDHNAEPLARINVLQSYCTRTRKLKGTKTGDTRAVPMHPTLAAILAAWRLTHWPRIYGRAPTEDDFVVPTRNMTSVDASDANHAMKLDLATLKLRIEAGEHRDRGGHDLRSWYKTRCIEDGADSLIIRRTTHAPPKDVDSGYERFSWATVCRELARLKVTILDGKVLELGTALSTAEVKAGKRWRKVVTPSRLELEFSA